MKKIYSSQTEFHDLTQIDSGSLDFARSAAEESKRNVFDIHEHCERKSIVVNTRCLLRMLTGVQRYTSEIVKRFPAAIGTISPGQYRGQLYGHFWEQFILPKQLHGNLLWSPANTGPIFYDNQVVTIHDMNVFDFPQWYGSKSFVIWYRYMLKKLVSRALHIITISNYSANRITAITKINRDKITVVPLGVSEEFKALNSEVVTNDLSSLELPSNRYILTLSSIAPNKNLGRLIDAWRIISKKIPDDIWLYIVGGTPSLAPNLHFAALPERVKFLGHVSDKFLPALYTKAIIFTLLSLNEGFGLPVLEAMACGAPVLAANAAALPEVVADAGMLVDPYSVTAIAQQIMMMVHDEHLLNELRKKSLYHAKQFSWDTTSQKILQILQSF